MNKTDSHRCRAMLAFPAAVAALAAAPASAEGLYVHAGTELDDESGYLLAAGVGGDFAERWSWDFGAGHVDTPRDLSGVTTTSYDFGVSHDFGVVGLRVGFGGWQDAELVATQKLAGALDFHGERWSFALQTELRESDFEPIEVDRTIIRRDGTPLTIVARADCAIDDAGMGARFRLSSESWSWLVGGMSYDYDDPECSFNLPALNFLRRATRDEFVQLADRVTSALSYTAGTQLLAETSFLDSRLGTSLSYTARRTYRVQYDHFEEAFFGLESDTLSGGAAFPVGAAYELEVYAGVTQSDSFSNVAFLGFSVLFAK
jgi:hypothetical protein